MALSIPLPVFELLGILFQGQRSPDVFILVYLQMRLSAKRCVFFYLGKSLVCFTRWTYEAQELPARTNVCNLSSDTACGPDFCHLPEIAEISARIGARVLFAGEAPGRPRARARKDRKSVV